MIKAVDHDEIVALFYAAAAHDIPWSAALERTAALFGSSASLLGVHRGMPDVVSMQSHNYDDGFLGEFFSGEIYANDPRIAYLDRVPLGGVYCDERLYDVSEMERDPWVKASIDRLGVFDQVGAKLRIPGDCFVSFGLLRTRAEGRIDADALAAFERLVPPLERSCALGHLIESDVGTRALLLELVAAKRDGLILIDRAGQVRFMNDAARALLDAGDGLRLRDGLLETVRPPETRQLGRLIAGVLGEFGRSGGLSGGQMLVSRPSRGRPYVLSVIAAPAREAFLTGSGIACVIHIQDLAIAPNPGQARLRVLFGLTHRESELAERLVETARLDLAARHCGMALNTARNHLRSIFGKSGTNSQAEAVQLFSRLV